MADVEGQDKAGYNIMVLSSECSKELAPNTEEFTNHFVEKVIPELHADGVFGEDVVVIGHNIQPVGGYGENHWMSCTLRVAVEVQDRKLKTTRTVRLVAKYQSGDSVWLDSAVTMRNEEHMYNQVVPLFQSLWDESSHGDPEPLNLFPKCYRAVSGARPLVVMDDMGADGFRLATSTTALDGAHVFLALNRLGRLHALSYCAKIRRKDDFLSVARELQDAEYSESRRAYQTGFIGGLMGPLLRRLAARGESVIDATTCEHLRHRLRSEREDIPSGAFDIMLEARSAEEPLAVIAHGDFCRNNIMFKYDAATGRPVDVRFFDLQTAKYVQEQQQQRRAASVVR
ncbi:Na(+)/H(+) antiporter NhaA [Frankliniella fusca]|uniref:Na(+)/H(+) antiporter NhaA n=1 Tax=Frankliniella fusca TaxID=407009 RepID=A0AAE1H812_9NEOP|nr:Na(+)/H(+) antiporter NhaA [Frankliniella fusca]